MEFLKEFNHILGPIISLATTLTILGGFGLWLKKIVNSGMVSKEDFTLALDNPDNDNGIKQLIHKAKVSSKEYTDGEIKEVKADYLERDKKATKWLNEMQQETTENGKLVSKIAGKVGVD